MNSHQPRPTKRWTCLWSAAGLVLLAGALAAAEPPVTTGTFDNLPEAIRTPMTQADGHLRRQEWEQARGLLQGLLAEAAQDVHWRGSVQGTLWRLAVAEAGLGRTEDARWHWQAAMTLGPPPPTAEIAPYGAVAEQLARTPVRQAGAAPAGITIGRGPGLTPPRRVQGEALDLDRLQAGAPPLWAEIELVVDAEGRVREPVVIDTSSSVLSYVVLEASRGWRYEPARRDGQPVATFVQAGINLPKEQPLGRMVTPTGPLADIDRLLRAGNWKRARGQADSLWIQALHNAKQQRPAFALLLTQRALAEAGLGQNDLAICHWQAAQGLEPLLFHADLADYGAAGVLLEGHRWGFPSIKTRMAEQVHPPGDPTDVVTKPSIRNRTEPEVPRVARKPGTKGTVSVESLIETTGTIRQPFVRLEDLGAEPNFAASSLDALCHWRFAPAMYRGQPVAVFYALTIGFRITH